MGPVSSASSPSGAPVVSAEHVAFGYVPGRLVLKDVSFELAAGEVLMVLGANGCGKSTLMRLLLGQARPEAGRIRLLGRDVSAMSPRDLARRAAMVFQDHSAPFPFTVEDVVAMGRTPHLGPLGNPSREDRAICAEALDAVGLSHLVAEAYTRLSGGERQMVLIARALAQGTETILLDEPTTFLDLAHQVDILRLCRRLNADGRTVVAVLHDLNQAARCAEHMIVMHDGRVRVTGSPRRIITEDLIEEVFGLAAVIAPDPVAGTPMVVPRHLGEVTPVGPAPQPSAEPVSAGTSPTARSQQDGQERNTDR